MENGNIMIGATYVRPSKKLDGLLTPTPTHDLGPTTSTQSR